MSTEASAYGLWTLVVVNAAVFIVFAFGFTRPRTAGDWRSFGDEYGRYRQRVGAFVPKLRSARAVNQS